MDIDELEKAIENLSSKELISLEKVFRNATAKAGQSMKRREKAERRIQKTYPHCECGRPITRCGFLKMFYGDCKPGVVERNGTSFGVIALDGSTYEDEATPAAEAMQYCFNVNNSSDRWGFGQCDDEKCGRWVMFNVFWLDDADESTAKSSKAIPWVWADDESDYLEIDEVTLTPMTLLAASLNYEASSSVSKED